MKSLYHIILALVLFATSWSGCSSEDTLMTVDLENTQGDASTISVKVNMSIPDPIKVTSRNAEFDAIESITLLCFNSQGKLVSFSTPTLDKKEGTLTADITYTTRFIHLIANQTINGLSLGSSTETEIANMVSMADKMIYWARVEIPSSVQGSANIETWFNSTFNAQNPIKMLRNQAKISITSDNDKEGKPYFIVTEFKVYNTWNKGTVTPYHQTKNAFPTITDESFGLDEWVKGNYIWIPSAQITEGLKKITMGDDSQDNIISPLYVYETEYSDNTFILFKGYNRTDGEGNQKWWRVAFKDGENKELNIRRNHHYEVIITGRLLLEAGYDSPEGACASDAKTVNDAYLSIAPEITAITDGKASLTVDETNFVITSSDEPQNLEFNFSVKKGEDSTEDIYEDKLEIIWDEEEGVQKISDYTELEKNITYKLTLKNLNESGGCDEIGGKFTIPLKSIGSDNAPLVGFIKIKYGKKLQRIVKITIIGKQSFEPVTVVDLEPEDSYKDPIAILTFTIPDSYQGKYPFNVYVLTEHFNVRKHIKAESNGGSDENEEIKHDKCPGLSLIFPGDAGYPENENNPIGYKYVYQVNAPGVHSIDLISSGVVTENAKIILQSEHFTTFTKDDISLMRD